MYVSWDAAADQSQSAQYRVSWPGGVRVRTFDQTVHGSTWQYFDTLPVRLGDEVLVELLGTSTDPNVWLSADAVRLGGGKGVIERVEERTGRPRWEEAAVLATQYNGAPTSVYDPYYDGFNGSDRQHEADGLRGNTRKAKMRCICLGTATPLPLGVRAEPSRTSTREAKAPQLQGLKTSHGPCKMKWLRPFRCCGKLTGKTEAYGVPPFLK